MNHVKYIQFVAMISEAGKYLKDDEGIGEKIPIANRRSQIEQDLNAPGCR